jgi:acyl carrier protein
MEQVTEQVDGTLRQQVVESIGGLLPRVLKRDLPAVPESTRLFDDLQLTSSTTLELLLEVEEDLDIQIDVEDIDQSHLQSIGSLADFVAEHAVAND